MKKKFIALILALVLCLSLCACGAKGTKLTLDNYETYFEVRSGQITSKEEFQTPVNPVNGLYRDVKVNGDYFTVYSHRIHQGIVFGIAVQASAFSDNFNYNDVKFKVKVSGYYDEIYLSGNMWFAGGNKSFEAIVEVPVNIAGDGSGVATVILPDGVVSCVEGFEEYQVELEVIEVSGVVTGR